MSIWDLVGFFRVVFFRAVIRSAGSLRVIVNCVLWAGQSCEKVNLKSARLTVMSGSEIEIVLIKVSSMYCHIGSYLFISCFCTLISVRVQQCLNHQTWDAAALLAFECN